MRLPFSALIAAVLFVSVTYGQTPMCNDPALHSSFISSIQYSGRFSDSELKQMFTAHLECLRSWVEDGGSADGLEVPSGLYVGSDRLVYKIWSLRLISKAVDRSHPIVSWIRSTYLKWPEEVQMQAIETMGVVGDTSSLPIIRKEARESSGERRRLAWFALSELSPSSVAQELFPLAHNIQDYKLLGVILLNVNDKAVEPVLRQLAMLDPDNAPSYLSHIESLKH